MAIVFASPLVEVGLAVLIVASYVKRVRDKKPLREPTYVDRATLRDVTANALSRDHEDALALAYLQRHQTTLASATEISYFLYAPHERAAIALAARLHGPGIATEIHDPVGIMEDGTESREWLVRLTTRGAPSIESLRNARIRYEALAGEFDGVYDGWEAAIG